MAKVSTILDLIDLGSVALPEFQRGYVWNRDQVRGLMHSLYRGYPVGSLLVWETPTGMAPSRGDQALQPGVVKLLLDGQQRMTTLYGIIRGKPPAFFDGNVQAFSGLYFHLEREEFEFYAPIKMSGELLWIDLSSLMQKGNAGLGAIIARLSANPATAPQLGEYTGRLNRLLAIREMELHVETVTGTDKTIDVVVEIFNKVNSGGTKLSKGDLALARICAGWQEAREMMKKSIQKWKNAGLIFDLDWLLRNLNSILTGEARFQFLHSAQPASIKDGLARAEKSIDTVLNLISGRLGLDTDQVMFGKGALPLLSHYVDRRGGKLQDDIERDRLLFWFVQSSIRGRYSGSTESVLDRDLHSVEKIDGGLERLINELLLAHGSLKVVPDHFSGWSLGARFYPVLYMLSRVHGARDWESGIELKKSLLGTMSSLEVHHIFPKAKLYEHKNSYSRSEVNAVANYCFLTKSANLGIRDRLPEEYFADVERRHPGALASQWIPLDTRLWKLDNYRDFLEARKILLAEATNALLSELNHGPIPERAGVHLEQKRLFSIPGSIVDADEEKALEEVNAWVEAQGLPRGKISYELIDAFTGEAAAVIDLAWPEGLQSGLSTPVALMINEMPETIQSVAKNNFLVFTRRNDFQEYVSRQVLQESA